MEKTISALEIERLPKQIKVGGKTGFKTISKNGRYVVYLTRDRVIMTTKGKENIGPETVDRYLIVK